MSALFSRGLVVWRCRCCTLSQPSYRKKFLIVDRAVMFDSLLAIKNQWRSPRSSFDPNPDLLRILHVLFIRSITNKRNHQLGPHLLVQCPVSRALRETAYAMSKIIHQETLTYQSLETKLLAASFMNIQAKHSFPLLFYFKLYSVVGTREI